jgi:pimeloyl-ACP methyl ester carboxylesterase
MSSSEAYCPRRVSRSEFQQLRHLKHHLRIWEAQGEARRTVWMLHGWMDVGASFQFLVDCLPDDWRVIAPDWRGYGLTEWPKTDNYFFADYMGDLDQLLDRYSPQAPVQVVAHSMGGNVSMLYSGVRPERIAALVSLEGIGMSALDGSAAPKRYARWLSELRDPPTLRAYPTLAAVAERLRKNNPRLRPDFALYLAGHWSAVNAQGEYALLADAAHKVINANLYRVDEVSACWQNISAPILLMMSDHLEQWATFVESDEFKARLTHIKRLEQVQITNSGHMLHHDQPERLAGHIRQFFEKHCP